MDQVIKGLNEKEVLMLNSLLDKIRQGEE